VTRVRRSRLADLACELFEDCRRARDEERVLRRKNSERLAAYAGRTKRRLGDSQN
jgi:hypothetical protein